MAKQIPLTQGKFALVDDEDYDFLMQWKWHFNPAGAGYAKRTISLGDGKFKCIQMHRLLLNVGVGISIDHIDRNGLNNQRINLRIANQSENMRNRESFKKSTSKFKGVYWKKSNKKWVAEINFNKEKKYLGIFSSEIEAALAYNKAAIELFGDFSILNIIDV